MYGMTQGIRSSRRLEWACGNAKDFLWLAEGPTIDHSTLCGFRTRFRREIKALFRQTAEVAMRMGMVRLNQVALDGTKVKANSSRHATATAETLAERLAALDAEVEKMLSACEEADRQEDDLFGQRVSPNHLPRELSDLKRRQEKLREALSSARDKEAASSSAAGSKKPKVPVADPASSIQPNKEGGYAPNYTPMAMGDGEKGLLVGEDVLAGQDEGEALVPMVDQVAQDLGDRPQEVLADGAYGSGQNLAALDERGMEGLIALEQRMDRPDNPARRADPAQPVAAEQWDKLPRNPKTKKLDRSAFVYDGQADGYWCPMGHRLGFVGLREKRRVKQRVGYRLYRCGQCVGCPLRPECVQGKTKYRTVSRDEYEPLREAMDARMKTPEGRKRSSRRTWIAETPFAVLKGLLGLRQFLLRGLAKVRTEWTWACTAFNLMKLVREIGRLRGRLAAMLG